VPDSLLAKIAVCIVYEQVDLQKKGNAVTTCLILLHISCFFLLVYIHAVYSVTRVTYFNINKWAR